jgi:hypothetical protein
MGFTTKVLLVIVILHFIIGIGWLAFKLSPRKEDKVNNQPPENADFEKGDVSNSE